MKESFKVWIIIEHEDENGEHTELDGPGSSLRSFDTEKEAWDFAERLTNIAGEMC